MVVLTRVRESRQSILLGLLLMNQLILLFPSSGILSSPRYYFVDQIGFAVLFCQFGLVPWLMQAVATLSRALHWYYYSLRCFTVTNRQPSSFIRQQQLLSYSVHPTATAGGVISNLKKLYFNPRISLTLSCFILKVESKSLKTLLQ